VGLETDGPWGATTVLSGALALGFGGKETFPGGGTPILGPPMELLETVPQSNQMLYIFPTSVLSYTGHLLVFWDSLSIFSI